MIKTQGSGIRGQGPANFRWAKPLHLVEALVGVVFLFACCAAAQDGSAASGGDPVLSAMIEEIARSKASLRMDRVPPPYYIEYSVTDHDEYTAEAGFGALKDEQRTRRRVLCAVVRIGDYRRDSYVGRGVVEAMPLDDDPIALRHQLWLATDGAYKAAAETLAAKASLLKEFPRDDPVDDFAREPVLRQIDPLARLDFDVERWRKTLELSSRLDRNSDEVLALETAARFSAVNRYFVNSEGTVTRNGQSRYLLSIDATAQAADDMMLHRSPAVLADSQNGLPSTEQFAAQAKAVVNSLKALCQAQPIHGEYRGPVLFLPDASNDIFAELLANDVLGQQPEPGDSNRTSGAYAGSFKTQVLPDFLTVVDDPTAAKFEGSWLAGSYSVDDEGVKAGPVTVVENGKLINYLVGRSPIPDFPVSNGRGRRFTDGPAAPASSNLFVRSSIASSREDLKKKMLELCRERNLEYGYVVETLGGIDSPRLIYRLYTDDGRQELVRGTALDQIDARALRDIAAVGNDLTVSNRPETLRSSVTCPSVLFRELVVRPAGEAKSHPPDYPPPRSGRTN